MLSDHHESKKINQEQLEDLRLRQTKISRPFNALGDMFGN